MRTLDGVKVGADDVDESMAGSRSGRTAGSGLDSSEVCADLIFHP